MTDEPRVPLTNRAAARLSYPLRDDGRTFLVTWIGWLPLAFLCGTVLGFMVGIAVGVFA